MENENDKKELERKRKEKLEKIKETTQIITGIISGVESNFNRRRNIEDPVIRFSLY